MNPQQIKNLVLDYIETYPDPISGWFGITENTSHPFFGFNEIMPTIEWISPKDPPNPFFLRYDYIIKVKYNPGLKITKIIKKGNNMPDASKASYN